MGGWGLEVKNVYCHAALQDTVGEAHKVFCLCAVNVHGDVVKRVRQGVFPLLPLQLLGQQGPC